jgi:hypothetical protein
MLYLETWSNFGTLLQEVGIDDEKFAVIRMTDLLAKF